MKTNWTPEWEAHRATWMAWPCHSELWQDNLPAAQEEFVELCRALTQEPKPNCRRKPEQLEILVAAQKGLEHPLASQDARHRLKGLPVRLHEQNYGDIWLRDTAPIFAQSNEGPLMALCFRFNGWGGKYILPGDDQVSLAVAKFSKIQKSQFDFVLEGGALENNGQGTVITTKQCLLNPNRSLKGKMLSEAEVEKELEKSLGVRKVIWLEKGLLNDHTDGHVDNLARFVSSRQVVCMAATESDDPNAEVYEIILQTLESSTTALGEKLEVTQIPSVGAYKNADGEIIPASYMNFYISNTAVVVPQYGMPEDSAAVKALAEFFPDRHVVGVSSRAILSGGGSFHCITQQEPS